MGHKPNEGIAAVTESGTTASIANSNHVVEAILSDAAQNDTQSYEVVVPQNANISVEEQTQVMENGDTKSEEVIVDQNADASIQEQTKAVENGDTGSEAVVVTQNVVARHADTSGEKSTKNGETVHLDPSKEVEQVHRTVDGGKTRRVRGNT